MNNISQESEVSENDLFISYYEALLTKEMNHKKKQLLQEIRIDSSNSF